jgi:hypothetical protein
VRGLQKKRLVDILPAKLSRLRKITRQILDDGTNAEAEGIGVVDMMLLS